MAIYNMSALNSQLSYDSSTGTYSGLEYQDYIAVSCQMPNVLEYNKVVRITFSCDFTGGTIVMKFRMKMVTTSLKLILLKNQQRIITIPIYVVFQQKPKKYCHHMN